MISSPKWYIPMITKRLISGSPHQSVFIVLQKVPRDSRQQQIDSQWFTVSSNANAISAFASSNCHYLTCRTQIHKRVTYTWCNGRKYAQFHDAKKLGRCAGVGVLEWAPVSWCNDKVRPTTDPGPTAHSQFHLKNKYVTWENRITVIVHKSPMAFEMTMPCTQARPAAKHICNLGCNPSYLSRTGRLRVNITLVFGGWILGVLALSWRRQVQNVTIYKRRSSRTRTPLLIWVHRACGTWKIDLLPVGNRTVAEFRTIGPATTNAFSRLRAEF